MVWFMNHGSTVLAQPCADKLSYIPGKATKITVMRLSTK